MDTKTKPRFMVGVVFLCLCLVSKSHSSLRADTVYSVLQKDDILSGNSTILSAKGIFEMGFFQPGPTPKYYVGVWYKQITDHKTVVWVANRENPVSDKFSSELKISEGNLVLFNESRIPIWSTDVKNSSKTVQALLLDTGNLVLNDSGSNFLEPLWQSFDHPTDTLLPGVKVGYNKIANTSQVLTSWRTSEDPAPGFYTLELDPIENTCNILWNMSTIYWNSGPWNDRTFSMVPDKRFDYIFHFSLASNENESYFTYSLDNNSNYDKITRIVMDVSGQIKHMNWLVVDGWNLYWSRPEKQCQVHAYCGAYSTCSEDSFPICRCLTGFEPKSQRDWDLADHTGGCVRRRKLPCKDSNSLAHGAGRDRFQKIPNILLPEPDLSEQADVEECESSCLNDCSCTAYAYFRYNCSIWTRDLLNLKQLAADDVSGRTLYIRLANTKRSNSKLYFIVSVIIATVLVTSGTICYVYFPGRKRVRTSEQGNGRHMYDTERSIVEFINSGQFREDEKKAIKVPFVALDSILAATDNFSEANKLGQGGFGPVYKGKFPGGQEIAIKKLSSGSLQGLVEFKNEVLLISEVQHRSLVRLLGYCIEGDEKLLVYEYMPNKSLDTFLFDQNLCALLNWERRFNIILKIAKGLLYLHHESRLKIIHRDLKTSNILLDGEMNPKISDFGLAKIFEGRQTEAFTKKLVGTYGYMSPEYALGGVFSIKSDVFSFGVMVLEIISGKRNTGFYQSEEALSLLDYAWKLWKENKTLDLMDTTLSDTCNVDEFLRCFNVGLLCVQTDPNDRPTMSNAVVMLISQSESLPSPKQPGFVAKKYLPCRAAYDDKPLSKNELTDTLHEGR